MLLVDFGESTCKFALVQERQQDLEVVQWGAENIRSFEYAAQHVMAKTQGLRQDAELLLVSLPPALWRSRIVQERIERKNAELRIDEKEKEALLTEIFSKVRLKLAQGVQDASGILAADIRVHKLEVLAYEIDGYEVPDILGFPGTRVNARLLAVFTLVKHLPMVDTVYERFSSLPSRVVHWTEALEEFSRVRGKDALYIDAGDASCRVALTSHGHVVFADEIPRGGKDFTLYLQDTLALGENTARDFKERYTAGDFSFQLREGVKKGFRTLAEDLVRNVCRSLRLVSATLPPSVLLFGGTSKLPEVQEAFQNRIFEDLPFHEKPSVSLLLPRDLWNVEFAGSLDPIFTPLFFLPYANKKGS